MQLLWTPAVQADYLKRYRRRSLLVLREFDPLILYLHRIKQFEPERICDNCAGLFIAKAVKLGNRHMSKVPLPCDKQSNCKVHGDLTSVAIFNRCAPGW